MAESENPNFSFDNLPLSVAELHAKIDRLTAMFEQLLSSTNTNSSPEIMTVEDVAAMLCKSVSTIYAMTSEHRIPFRKQGNKLYFIRPEIKAWLMDSVVPKDTPKRRSKPDKDSTTDESNVETEHPQSESRDEICTDNTEADKEESRYLIEHRTHSKSGADIFAVLFSDEIECAGERKFLQSARDFHGYWSDFGNGGYIFNSLQEAENFAKTIRGKEETDQVSPLQAVMGNDGLTANHITGKQSHMQDEQPVCNGNTFYK